MTTDPFTDAARAEAERYFADPGVDPLTLSVIDHAMHMAEWARTHLAAQEPTDAEVIAALGAANRTALNGQRFDAPLAFYADNVVEGMRAALSAARAARRDEETR